MGNFYLNWGAIIIGGAWVAFLVFLALLGEPHN